VFYHYPAQQLDVLPESQRIASQPSKDRAAAVCSSSRPHQQETFVQRARWARSVFIAARLERDGGPGKSAGFVGLGSCRTGAGALRAVGLGRASQTSHRRALSRSRGAALGVFAEDGEQGVGDGRVELGAAAR
jgi:hypothetical protein